jgi:hypothetical protein
MRLQSRDFSLAGHVILLDVFADFTGRQEIEALASLVIHATGGAPDCVKARERYQIQIAHIMPLV